MHLLVSPRAPGGVQFSPFPLPRLPLSLVRWSGAVADLYWREERACMALVLLLEPTTGRWLAIPPSQRCDRHRPHWRLRERDFSDLPPQILTCGSFQTAAAADVFAAARCVRAYDGVHLIQQPGGGDRLAWIFLTCDGGEALLAHPVAVLVDDVEDTLRRYAHRLCPA